MATRRKIITPGSAVAVFARGFSDSLNLLFSYFGFPPVVRFCHCGVASKKAMIQRVK
jgi:hypothetical protein